MLLKEVLYISCMKDSSSEAWWEWLAAHYDQDQKEPFLIMKKVLINCKLIKRVYAKQLTRNYKPTANVSINLMLGLPFNGNTEQIGNTDK